MLTNTDLVSYIFSYLTPDDLVNVSAVCKGWTRLSRDEQVWTHHQIHIIFPGPCWYNYTAHLFEESLSETLGLSQPKKLRYARGFKYRFTLFSAVELDLRSLGLSELPRNIGKLKNLRTISLYNNSLTKLPVELGNLTNLVALDLSENRLTKIPIELDNLLKLEILDLSYNQLTEIPADIGNLDNLKYLQFAHNQLIDIPIGLSNLDNLNYLGLAHNYLTHIPFELVNVALELEDNPISVFPDMNQNHHVIQ